MSGVSYSMACRCACKYWPAHHAQMPFIARYAEEAELKHKVSPHKLRHFLLTWLKKQGIDDALIQPYSGHATRKSLEVYSKLAISEAQEAYDEVIGRFPL